MGTECDKYRYFLKDSVRRTIDFSLTGQARGAPPPPIEKPVPDGAIPIDLTPKDQWTGIRPVDLLSAIAERRSHRTFTSDPLTLDELSYLLWATQGIRVKPNESTAYRTVPSAGCRHALETYLCVLRVEGLKAGIYRYLPLEHQLLLVAENPALTEKLAAATFQQTFIGRSAVTFVWTTIPYRMEWRYHTAAHKVIALDAGHVCQNLYLSCSAIGAGTCAVAAYHQEMMDRLLGVDGNEEFTLYLAPVGKVPAG